MLRPLVRRYGCYHIKPIPSASTARQCYGPDYVFVNSKGPSAGHSMIRAPNKGELQGRSARGGGCRRNRMIHRLRRLFMPYPRSAYLQITAQRTLYGSTVVVSGQVVSAQLSSDPRNP